MRGAVTCFVGLGELVSGDADHNARVNNAGRDWNSVLSNGAIWRLAWIGGRDDEYSMMTEEIYITCVAVYSPQI